MSERDEIAAIIALAIRGDEENGVNYVSDQSQKGIVRIDADIDLRVVADAIIEYRARKKEEGK